VGNRVLIVEDDRDLLELMSLILESAGFSTEQAFNGRAGLEALSEQLPGLILLDMRMPVMNGWEFAAELRRLHQEAVPIVVVTAAEDAQKRAEEIGAEGWLSKPFAPRDLVDVVTRHWHPNGSPVAP
jgi:DNA-binding response OmpR family regulator